MTARIVLVGAGASDLGSRLASAIRAEHVLVSAGGVELESQLDAATDGFVLEGDGLDVSAAERVDAFLDARAASVELALWIRSDAAPSAGDDELLSHYRGRVVEVDAAGLTADELFPRALDSIREATASLVG